MIIDLTVTATNDDRSNAIHLLKIASAAYHFCNTARCVMRIAKRTGIQPEKIISYGQRPEWKQAVLFFDASLCDASFDLCNFYHTRMKRAVDRDELEFYTKKFEEYKLNRLTQPEPADEKVPLDRTIRTILYNEQAGCCNGCKIYFPFRNMTLDHIQPKSRGGTNARENLQLLCAACNHEKGSRSHAEFIASLRLQGIIGVQHG